MDDKQSTHKGILVQSYFWHFLLASCRSAGYHADFAQPDHTGLVQSTLNNYNSKTDCSPAPYHISDLVSHLVGKNSHSFEPFGAVHTTSPIHSSRLYVGPVTVNPTMHAIMQTCTKLPKDSKAINSYLKRFSGYKPVRILDVGLSWSHHPTTCRFHPDYLWFDSISYDLKPATTYRVLRFSIIIL